ncbi:MFS transporter [Phyllobacterium phragmitis]|uniref:MFS transporter n=1 Tax=Phyllobacterium phragmitis TaxID=2670329 RepID=A0A2S9IPW1_9HYPH|nr:MFS transporter [Phyllobacterium phragmitis]PRD42550.1 MFS transporter [Phyllobacterium phragmitis]
MLASDLRPEMRSEMRWLSSGFLLTLCSGFGQTYFIALFAGYLKTDLAISDGQFGSLYTIGTLASAALLMWAGKFADQLSIRWLGVGVMAGLALTSLAMASVASVWILVFVLFGLRFFGQGMLTHVAMTAMGRWFNRKRGRAVSIAALGFPAGEAVLPMIAVASIGLIGWRSTWVAAAIVLFALPIPILIWLLKHERRPTAGLAVAETANQGIARREWTRSEVLKSPLFYALMPGVLTPSFIVTGIFFNQVTIVALKGWELSWFAASFPFSAGVSVLSALTAGWMVDRFGARHLLPTFLVPLGLATLILTYAASPYVLPVFMALVGLSLGSASTIQGALWAELYGTEHLGAIRALVMAGVVFASALSPGLIGVLMDAGVPLETLLLAMAAYCFIAALWMGALMPRLHRLAMSS